MRPWPFILLSLAAFRITRLVVLDTVTEPIREATTYRLPDDGIGGYVKTLFDCPWCVGFWISVLTVVAWVADRQLTMWVAVPFALSAIVGLVARNLDSNP